MKRTRRPEDLRGDSARHSQPSWHGRPAQPRRPSWSGRATQRWTSRGCRPPLIK